ncbi:8-amino-7-oxononanoate synthase [Aestuariibacter sp. AA17]|uniref:8-amino-7-oxononanoate synthase n=1 Tax=Fluctibacter corallii TaxID=2984329 RepID=A0ABT3ABD9_9ALTE|nr:8-amino-7-oxononanoate synthase [Aestuariibacter sp. AA17]MCV2885990.1 8-amino-7-oxononanoate synthase [Aestuariibacter sp. AA17]
MAFSCFEQALLAREREGLLRKRQSLAVSTGTLIDVAGQHYINFSSNDYLGLRQSMPVLQAWVDGLSLYGGGSGASPLVTGHTQAHLALETYLAEHLQRDNVVLFNSGFSANQAICRAFGQVGGSVICDKLMHASFIEGMASAVTDYKRFKHNDYAHAETLLAQRQGETLLATEGVFSMDGDKADLVGLSALCEAQDAWLMVDDAHGFGVLGETGLGSAQASGLNQSQLPVVMGTFGKAIGTGGAFVAGPESFIEYLVNFAKEYVYSTAMPPAQACATLASIQHIACSDVREQLNHNITLFKQLAVKHDIPLLPSDTAIQPVMVAGVERVLAVGEKLKSLGIWATAMRAPTVPKGQERVRITLSAAHTDADISALVDALSISLNSVLSNVVNG